jgi:hypothetical protein
MSERETPKKFLSTFTFSLFHLMPRAQTKQSKTLSHLFGTTDDREVSHKLIKKLLQYNMKYEEITKVILSHSERAFLDARLISLVDYYKDLQSAKKSEVETFLASLPEHELKSIAI